MADKPDWSAVQQTLLFNAVVPGAPNTIDTSSFNSVTIVLNNDDVTTPIAVKYLWTQLDGTTVMEQGLLSCDQPTMQPAWTLPVMAPVLQLVITTPGHVFAKVYGSTVPAKRQLLYSSYPIRALQANVPNATPANTLTQLLDLDVNYWPNAQNVTGYNGQVSIDFGLTTLAGSATWQLVGGYRDDTGALVRHSVLTTTVARATVMVGHPFAYCSWWVRPNGVTNALSTVSIEMTPASVS